MDLNQTTTILKKINRLHELINTIGEASSTEMDLLKAYVVDLYEAVAMSDIETIEDLEVEEMKKKLKKKKKVEKKLQKELQKKAIVQQEELLIDEEEEETEDDHEVIETVKEEAVDVKDVGEENVKPEKLQIPEELLELFDINVSAELSDRLANAPIADLTKAMGINEKMFTVKELFGGNQDEMNNILSALNGLNQFDEAKEVLMHSVAQKYNWTNSDKIKKAKNFIKLVKRRYN